MDTLVINMITQDFISLKITRPKKYIYIQSAEIGVPPKPFSAKKSGPALAGPAVPPTTALKWLFIGLQKGSGKRSRVREKSVKSGNFDMDNEWQPCTVVLAAIIQIDLSQL